MRNNVVPMVGDEPDGVRVEKRLIEDHQTIEESLVEEHIEIERVLKNEPVNGPQPVREEGDTVIVPVVKEVLQVEKRWVLTEEIRLIRRCERRNVSEPVTVLHEEATVEGVDTEGRPTPAQGRRSLLRQDLPSFVGKLDR